MILKENQLQLMENGMNRLAIIAATGILALMLTACNEDKNSKPAEGTTTEATAVQPSDDKAASDKAATDSAQDSDQKSTDDSSN